MNKVVRKKQTSYTTISNVFLRDKNLSIKAKGFLAVVMGLPEKWDFSIKGICSILKEGKTAIYNVIQELKEYHYCETNEIRDEKGLYIGLDYIFYEEPHIDNPHQECPHTENQDMDNEPQYNKEENSKIDRIKETENKEERDKSLSKKDSIDFNAIVKCWNETNPSLATVRMLNDKRKSKIRTLLSSNSATVEDLLKAIKIISMSSFCQGKNDRNWEASFDWLINDTKSCFSRLFEGAYSFTQDEKRELKAFLGEENERTKPSLPEGWTKERYDMFIRNGYTITPEGRVFLDGKEYK